MEKKKGKKKLRGFGFTFNEDVTIQGPMFDIHDNQHVHFHGQGSFDEEDDEDEDEVEVNEDYLELSKERLAESIFNLQSYFWGRSSYAVVFCVLRDYFKFPNNQTLFEREIMSLPFKQMPDHVCAIGVVSSTFSDNPYMKLNVEKWKQNGASSRVMTLVHQIRNSLSATSE